MNDTARELLAGTIGGCAGIVVGQPLDTVKVRLQARGTMYRSTMDCVQRTFANEGLYGFFRGMTSPLVGNGPLNAILFSAYGSTIRWLEERAPNGARADPERPPMSHVLAAGHVAGVLQCLIVAPTELVKCQLQVQMQPRSHHSSMFQGPVDCLRQRVAVLGPARGIFQGMACTLLRDIPSFGFYFGAYELVKRGLEDAGLGRGATAAAFVGGGVAGLVSWGCIYPLDAVKSVVQSAPIDTPPQELRMLRVAAAAYRSQGAPFFYRGLASALLRAFPVNGVTFVVYEWCKSALSRV